MDIKAFYNLDIVLVCGLPGSGKSHFAKKYFQNDNRKRINRKEIRRHLFEMITFGESWHEENFDQHDEHLVKHVERRIYEHFLQENCKVLVDNTSMRKASRKIYIDTAKRMNKSIGIIFLNTPLQKCIMRNQQQDDQVPNTVISNEYAGMELPEKSEGFDSLGVIQDY